MSDITKEKRDRVNRDRLAYLERLFKLAVHDEWNSLQPGKTIIPDEKLREIVESRRFKPHFFYDYPFYAVVNPDDDGHTSPKRMRFSRCSLQILNARIEHYKKEGYRVVHLPDFYEGSFFTPDHEDNICEWCGGPFADGLTAREKGKRIFCCDECKKKFRNFERVYSQMNKEGKIADNLQLLHDLGAPGIELLRILRDPCVSCGGIIPDDKQITAKFCSDKCRFDWHNEKKKLRD